ncbi:MAG: 1,4-dihydroxy-2-naphthoate octaprenyltransferase [Thermodesulfobacteriota bacterium]
MRLVLYIMAARPQFFPAVVVPVVLGAAAAWHLAGTFSLWLLIPTLLAAVLYHGGINVINDYFDHLNGTDDINKTPLTPFTGGSRMIQKGLMTPLETLVLGTVLLTAGSLIGIYLVFICGWPLLLIGLVGLTTGLLYSAPPVFFAGRGLGELMVGLNFGVLTVAGSYFVQTGSLRAEIIFISLPISFLIAALLYINEFPDYEADRAAGKRNLVVRLGPERGRWGLVVIVAGAYLSLIVGVLLGLLPPASLIALLSLVFAWKGATGLLKDYAGGQRLVPSIKSIIAAHTTAGVLLTLAHII